MQIKTGEYEIIRVALSKILKSGCLAEVDYDVEKAVTEAIWVLNNIDKRRLADNRRMADYVNEKRKTDKCFARGPVFREQYMKKHGKDEN